MLYRTYGQTGKDISAIGFGAMRLATPVTPKSVGESVDMLLYAHEKGINYFDTAPLYVDDRSEEIVGKAIRQMKPGSYYVSTKSAKAKSDEVRQQLETALERLGVDCIDFFHIWCLLNNEGWEERKQGGAVEEAMKAKDEGLIKHLVFSTHMTGDDITGVIAENIFEGMTLGYSAINFPYRAKGLEAADKADIGVVTMNPLAGGVIPQNADRFDFIRNKDDPDVVTAALRFNLSHPAITSALVGFSSKKEVDQAVAALEGFTPYDSEFFASLEKRIEAQFDGLCTGCGYCLPCPREVPIPRYMDAYNMYILKDDPNDVLMRLKWHWDLKPEDAGACDGCGQCEQVCTQGLPIIERLKILKDMKPPEGSEDRPEL